MAKKKKPQPKTHKNKPELEIESHHTYGKITLAVLICSFLLFAIFYSGITYNALNKSLPRLTVAGYDVGNKSLSEIKKIISKVNEDGANQKVVIKADEDRAAKTYKELGLSVDVNQTASYIYRYGKYQEKFPTSRYLLSSIQKPIEVSVAKLWNTEAEKNLEEMFKDKKVDPENAKVKAVGDSVQIEPEKAGSSIDIKSLKQEVERCFVTNSCHSSIITKKATQNSKVTSKDLEPYLSQIGEIANSGLTLESSRKKFTPNKDEIINFIDLEKTVEQKIIVFSDGKIDEYLNAIGDKINVKGRPRKISTYDHSVLSEGKEGIKLDLDASRKSVKEALQNKAKTASISTTTAPIEEVMVEPGFTPGKYPGKYIELNLSEQVLYTWEGSNMTGSYRISSGKWSMPTPTGEFSILSKDPRAYSSKYNLYMPYWMQFTGAGHGIHELPEWPGGAKEGEAHLGTPVSHGCVRLGVGAAETVYNWADVGTPVYIHR